MDCHSNSTYNDAGLLNPKTAVSQALYHYSNLLPRSVERVLLGYLLDISHLSPQFSENKKQIRRSTLTRLAPLSNSKSSNLNIKEYLRCHIDRGIEDLLRFFDQYDGNNDRIEDNDYCWEFSIRIMSFLLPFYTCIWLLKDGGGRGGSILFNPSLLQAAKGTPQVGAPSLNHMDSLGYGLGMVSNMHTDTIRSSSSEIQPVLCNSRSSSLRQATMYPVHYFQELERLVSMGRERRHRFQRFQQHYDPLMGMYDEDAEEELLLREYSSQRYIFLSTTSNGLDEANSGYQGIQLDSQITAQFMVTDFHKDMVHYPVGETHVLNAKPTNIYSSPDIVILLLFITLENILGIPGKSLWQAFCTEVGTNRNAADKNISAPQPTEGYRLHDTMTSNTCMFFDGIRKAAALDGTTVSAPFYPFAVVAEMAAELSKEGVALEASLASNQEASLSINLRNNTTRTTTNACNITQYKLLLRAYLLQIPERLLLCTPTSLRRKVAAQRGSSFLQILKASSVNVTGGKKTNPQSNGVFLPFLLEDTDDNDGMFFFSNNINDITFPQGHLINNNLSNKTQNCEIILQLCMGSVSLFRHLEEHSDLRSLSKQRRESINTSCSIDFPSKSQGCERVSQLHLLLGPILAEIRWYQQCILPLPTSDEITTNYLNLVTDDRQCDFHAIIHRYIPKLTAGQHCISDQESQGGLSGCKHPMCLKAFNSMKWTQALLISCGGLMVNPSLQHSSMGYFCDQPRQIVQLHTRQLNLLHQFLKVLTTPTQRSVSIGESSTTSEATPLRALISFRCQASPRHLSAQITEYCSRFRQTLEDNGTFTHHDNDIRTLYKEDCILELIDAYEGRKSMESSMWKSFESVFELISANKFAIVLACELKRQRQSEVDNDKEVGKPFSHNSISPLKVQAKASLETLKLFVEVIQRQTDDQHVYSASSNSEDEANTLGGLSFLYEDLASSDFRNVSTRGGDVFSTLAASYGNSVFFLWGTNLIKRCIEYLRLESCKCRQENEKTHIEPRFSDLSLLALSNAKERLLRGYGRKEKASMSRSKHLSTADMAHKLFFGSPGHTIQSRERQRYEPSPIHSNMTDNDRSIWSYFSVFFIHNEIMDPLENSTDIARHMTNEAYISYWQEVSHKHGPLHTAAVRGNTDTVVSIIDGCLDTISSLVSNERQLAMDAIMMEVNFELTRVKRSKEWQKEKWFTTESRMESNLRNSEYGTTNTNNNNSNNSNNSNIDSSANGGSLMNDILPFFGFTSRTGNNHLRIDENQLSTQREINGTPQSDVASTVNVFYIKKAFATSWRVLSSLSHPCSRLVFYLRSDDNNLGCFLLFLWNFFKTVILRLWTFLSQRMPMICCVVTYCVRMCIGNHSTTLDTNGSNNIVIGNDASPEVDQGVQSRATTDHNVEGERREDAASNDQIELKRLEDHFTKVIRRRVRRSLLYESSDLFYRLGAASTDALVTALLHGKLDMALAVVAAPEVILVESSAGIINRTHNDDDSEAKNPICKTENTKDGHLETRYQLHPNRDTISLSKSSCTVTTTKVVYFRERILPISVSQSLIDCATSAFSSRLRNIPINFLEDMIRCNYSYLRFRSTMCGVLNGFGGHPVIGEFKTSISTTFTVSDQQNIPSICPVVAPAPDSEETKNYYMFEEAIKVARLLSILRNLKDSQEIDGPFVPSLCKQHILHSCNSTGNQRQNDDYLYVSSHGNFEAVFDTGNREISKASCKLSSTPDGLVESQHTNIPQRGTKSFYVIDPLFIDPIIGRRACGCTCLAPSPGRVTDECQKRTKALLAFVHHPYVKGHTDSHLGCLLILFIFYFAVYIGLSIVFHLFS